MKLSGDRLIASPFVLPTRADNMPNALVEAHAWGGPAVTFCVGGVHDIEPQGETGLLAAPEDASFLRDVLFCSFW